MVALFAEPVLQWLNKKWEMSPQFHHQKVAVLLYGMKFVKLLSYIQHCLWSMKAAVESQEKYQAKKSEPPLFSSGTDREQLQCGLTAPALQPEACD